MYYLGNLNLLNRRLVGFLSSRDSPTLLYPIASSWLETLDIHDDAIYSGAHSPLERYVVKEQLSRGGAAICILPRSLPSSIGPKLKELLDTNRLLLASPFKPEQRCIREHNAMARNRLIIDTADILFIGSIRENGSLEELLMGKQWYELTSFINETIYNSINQE